MGIDDVWRNGKPKLKWLCAIVSSQFIITAGAAQAWAAGVLAVSADNFLNSLGVITQVNQGIPSACYVTVALYGSSQHPRWRASRLWGIDVPFGASMVTDRSSAAATNHVRDRNNDPE